MILLSADAEQLFRTWRASQLLFFACLCSYFAMGCGLDVLSRRVPRVRELRRSNSTNPIVMTVLVFAIAVVFSYPPRPFVYPENGHWMSKSRAGTWEVDRRAAIDSYKRNTTWDCALILPLIAQLAASAIASVRAASRENLRET